MQCVHRAMSVLHALFFAGVVSCCAVLGAKFCAVIPRHVILLGLSFCLHGGPSWPSPRHQYVVCGKPLELHRAPALEVFYFSLCGLSCTLLLQVAAHEGSTFMCGDGSSYGVSHSLWEVSRTCVRMGMYVRASIASGAEWCDVPCQDFWRVDAGEWAGAFRNAECHTAWQQWWQLHAAARPCGVTNTHCLRQHTSIKPAGLLDRVFLR